jgi:pyruvate-formate lyase
MYDEDYLYTFTEEDIKNSEKTRKEMQEFLSNLYRHLWETLFGVKKKDL